MVESPQFELFAVPADPQQARGYGITAWRGIAAWLEEIDRLSALMRPRSGLYARFDVTARQLTEARIRMARDLAAVAALETRLTAIRYAYGHGLHDLDRVWSRHELGSLLCETGNRHRQLGLGRLEPRAKGPALDPSRLPDDRLEGLIQRHRDPAVVDALRAERERRAGREKGGREAAGRP